MKQASCVHKQETKPSMKAIWRRCFGGRPQVASNPNAKPKVGLDFIVFEISTAFPGKYTSAL